MEELLKWEEPTCTEDDDLLKDLLKWEEPTWTEHKDRALIKFIIQNKGLINKDVSINFYQKIV